MESLDNVDMKILAELDLDARQPITKIAKKLRISKEVAGYRIRKMEREAYIKGYYTVLNPSLLGITYYRILLKFYSLDIRTEKEILTFLTDHRYVGWIASCFGKYDLIGVIEVENAYQFDQFLYEFLIKYGKYIVEKEITIFSASFAFNKKFLTDNYKTEVLEYIHQPKKIKVDKMDLKIIKNLSTNARKTLVEIAKDLSLTPKAISDRIKKLENSGVLQGYRTSIDFSKLGYLHTHTLIKLENIETRKKLMNFFREHKSTLYGAFQIGAYDISIESVVRNLDELNSFIHEMRNLFIKDIKNYDALILTKEYKLTYYPFQAFQL